MATCEVLLESTASKAIQIDALVILKQHVIFEQRSRCRLG
jgi:hypothetical protein